MSNKFTAIYIENWHSGSHKHMITYFRRIERAEKETIEQMLRREGILDVTVYLFHGHPELEGEDK